MVGCLTWIVYCNGSDFEASPSPAVDGESDGESDGEDVSHSYVNSPRTSAPASLPVSCNSTRAAAMCRDICLLPGNRRAQPDGRMFEQQTGRVFAPGR